MTTIVKAVQTCAGRPSEWDVWTDAGQYLYLRYRSGVGTAEEFDSPDYTTWGSVTPLAEFDSDDQYGGDITLAEFCKRAGLLIAENAEIS